MRNEKKSKYNFSRNYDILYGYFECAKDRIGKDAFDILCFSETLNVLCPLDIEVKEVLLNEEVGEKPYLIAYRFIYRNFLNSSSISQSMWWTNAKEFKAACIKGGIYFINPSNYLEV